MLRISFFSCIVIACFLFSGNLCYAQGQNIHPYFGASLNVDSAFKAGWGIEAGLRFSPIYAGIEYGAYAYPIQTGTAVEYTLGRVPPPLISAEQFWGIHAGYVFSSSLYVGIVVLKSYEQWNVSDSTSGYVSTMRTYLNIGPDFRYAGIDDGHIYLAFALTYRRGLKAGLGYMF